MTPCIAVVTQVDFANGDWAIRETLQAVEDIQRDEAETGGIPRFASLSAMAALASKYLQRSLPKEDFKAQLLHLEVCPALADIVLRLLQNCGPIVLPVRTVVAIFLVRGPRAVC